MLTDAHVAKLLLDIVKEGRCYITPGFLMERLGLVPGQYVYARGTQLRFIDTKKTTTTVTGNFQIRENMKKLAEGEEFVVGDPVKVIQRGKVFKGRVKKSANGRYMVDFAGEKPGSDREYTGAEMGRDEDEKAA